MDTITNTTTDLNEEEKEFLIFEAVERVLRAIHDLRQLSSAVEQTTASSSTASSKEEEEHEDVVSLQLDQNLISGEQILEAWMRMRSSLPHNPSPNGGTTNNEYVSRQFMHLYITLFVKKVITEECGGCLYVEIHNFGTLIRVFRCSSSSPLQRPRLELTEGFLKKVEISKEEEGKEEDNDDDDSSSSSSSSSSDGDHNVCMICLDRMKIGDEVVAFGPCSHIFHLDCVLKWVQRETTTCPLCRSQMPSFIMEVIYEKTSLINDS